MQDNLLLLACPAEVQNDTLYGAGITPPASCPTGTKLDPVTGVCVSATVVPGLCPAGQLPNPTKFGACEAPPACKQDETFNFLTWSCDKQKAPPPLPGCPVGQLPNPTKQGACEAPPACPQGQTFNAQTWACQQQGVKPVGTKDEVPETPVNWPLWGAIGAVVVGAAALIGSLRAPEYVVASNPTGKYFAQFVDHNQQATIKYFDDLDVAYEWVLRECTNWLREKAPGLHRESYARGFVSASDKPNVFYVSMKAKASSIGVETTWHEKHWSVRGERAGLQPPVNSNPTRKKGPQFFKAFTDRGDYVDLIGAKNGNLILRPTSDGVKKAKELLDWRETNKSGIKEDEVWMLEDHMGGEWEFVLPEEVGALTDATIISKEAERDDNGELFKIGRVYAHMNYQVEDPIETWASGKDVIFQGA
jgi:hypothetical protein